MDSSSTNNPLIITSWWQSHASMCMDYGIFRLI